MELEAKITNDVKEAMKAKEKEKLNALRYLKSMLIENKTSKQPKAEIDVVIALHKKLKDTAEQFPADSEQRGQILAEAKFVQAYMPQSIDEAEVRSLIQGIVANMENPQMGMVMKELSPHIKGRFDSKLANQMVQEAIKK